MKTCTRIGMLVLLTGLACGCDAGWDLYEAIEVGQPLPGPAELPEGSTRKVAGLEWVKIDLGGLPWRSHYTATHAAVGPDGNVRVKAYSRRHQSHWLLFVATETRLAMELDVPEEAFRDTPATKGFIASVLQAFANAMVGQDTAEREAAEAPAPPDAVSSEAVRTARRQRLDRILALAAKARNASVEVQSDVTDVPATQPAPGADVASYAWAAYAIMTGMSCPAGESEELVTSIPVDVKSTMMIGMTLAMMPALTEAFVGVTEPDWAFRRTNLSSSMRVTNLGDRRVRIELKTSGLEDSVMPVLTTGPPSGNGDGHD